MSERTVTTTLLGRDRLSPATNSASRGASKLQGVLGKVGGVAKGAMVGGLALAATGVAVLGKWVVDGVKGAISYQTVLAKTAQVLKTTGNVAGTSVEGVKGLAAHLETLSGVDEELIINSQNVLATFTNIRNVGKDRIFSEATKSALDMSVALGSDLQGASIQVGKALNDPIKGVSALSKVGVTFTDSQKKVIASLVKTGDTAGAQKVILQELNKEFGGQAAAAGKGFEGTMARLQDVIGDTGRDLGQLLLPKLTAAAEWLGKKIPLAVQDFKEGWTGVGSGAATDVGQLADSLHRLADQFSGLNKQVGGTDGNMLLKFAHSGIGALTTLSEGMQLLGANWRIITATIEKWNLGVQLSFQKMVNGIRDAGASLPGPMGKHFRKMADDGKARAAELQGKLDKTNTRIAQGQADALVIKLRHLGREKPTPKVKADIAQAQRQLAKVRSQLNGLPKGKTVTVHVNTQYAVYGNKGGSYQGGTFVKFKAAGGPVYKGQPYVVGEKRPELFVPNQNGTIMPKLPTGNAATGAPWRGGGGGNTYITLQVSGVGDRQLGDAVVAALKRRPAGSERIPAHAVGGR